MAATQHLALRPEVGPGAALRPGAPADRARLDRPRLHRRAHDRLRRVRGVTSADFTLERVAEATRAAAEADRAARRDDSRRQARLVLVDDGRQPEPRGRPHGAGDHQPRADDRQHRPARHRRQLDHRPVQRDGLAAVQQHHQPARRPRLRQRRASRRRSPTSWASTRRAFPTEPSWAYDQIIEGILRGEDSRACGSSPRTRPTPGSTRTTLRDVLDAARLPGRAGHVHDHRDGAAGATWCCRRPAGARRKARSSTPSGASA